MLLTLSRLIPFRDYLYAAAAIAVLVWYNIHVHNLEVGYASKRVAAVEAAVAAQGQKASAAASAAIALKEQQYADHLSKVETNYETELQGADAQHSADLRRVRQLEAAGSSNTNPVLSGAGGSAPGQDVGPSSAQLLGVGTELADALRRDDAQLKQCWDERDSLTGK